MSYFFRPLPPLHTNESSMPRAAERKSGRKQTLLCQHRQSCVTRKTTMQSRVVLATAIEYVMVYAHYDVLSTPPTYSGPKPSLLPLAYPWLSPFRALRSYFEACRKALWPRQTSYMYEHVNARHLRLAKPVLMPPAKWSDKMRRQMPTE